METDEQARMFLLAPREAVWLGIPNEEKLNPLPWPFAKIDELKARAEALRDSANQIDCSALAAGGLQMSIRLNKMDRQRVADTVIKRAARVDSTLEEEALAYGALKL
ncbi:MAG: hypothetical protein WA843_02650 [Candidatus Saccharimonadales bacterium]